MAKDKTTAFFCKECGYESAKWYGMCPSCHAYNSMVEAPKENKRSAAGTMRMGGKAIPRRLEEISTENAPRIGTGSEELDRVLGGGILPGSLILTGGDLAFDHGKIIETGIRRLRGKIDYTEIGFRFLANMGAFSLSELQNVFEAVLGEKIDKSNFRRTIINRYEKTGKLKQTDLPVRRGQGRPAALYSMTMEGNAR